ncbi:MAG: 3'-5' exonuclease [Rikenellaceae bacterium]
MEKFKEHITPDEINLLPLVGFEGEIVVADTTAVAHEAIDYLMQQPIIGFDTETRPCFKKGAAPNNISLLQLSDDKYSFLFRLHMLKLENKFFKPLERENILKIGAAVRDDIKGLQRLRNFTPRGFVDLQSIVGEHGINDLSLRSISAIVLGAKISKAQRLSNWESQQLTEKQQIYAATDAWICHQIYLKLLASK